MSITSGERHDLHTRLSEILGENQANVLMEHLPPVGWADVATKGDLGALGTELRGEMAGLQGEMVTLGVQLGSKIDIESVNRKADMETLMSRVLREQRVFLTAIFLAISTLVALVTIFG